MKPGLFFIYFLIITVLFFVFLFTKTDFPQRLSEMMSKNIDDLQGQIDELDDKIQQTDEKIQEEQYTKLKKKMKNVVRKGFIAVVLIQFENREEIYQIVGYKNKVSLRKSLDSFGDMDFKKGKKYKLFAASEEYIFKSLDELYESVNFDSICLKRDWKEIKMIKIFKATELTD